jgi:uncharacterized membrane protein
MSDPNQSSGGTPPGWYPDGQGGQRWWDGTAWTEHTLPPPNPSDRPEPPAQPSQPGPSDVTQVRPQHRQDSPAQQQPGGDRPSAQEPGHPPAAMPTQVAGSGPAQPYPGQQPGQPGAPQQGYPGQQGGGYPGQPGQPAWQGPPPGGSGGGISGKMIGIIGGAAVAVIAVIVVLFLVLGGSSGPKGVVEDFLDADSCSEAEDLVTEEFAEAEGGCTEEDLAGFDGGEEGDVDTEVKDEKIDGDKATVEVEASGSFGGEDFSQTVTFSLVKEDGDWKIDGIG